MRINARTLLGWIGVIILVVTAMFHSTGYSDAKKAAEAFESGSFFATALPALWLFPSIHWLFAALIGVFALHSSTQLARLLLFGVSVLLAIDAGLLYFSIGPFIGELMLLVSAAMFGVAAFRPTNAHATVGSD